VLALLLGGWGTVWGGVTNPVLAGPLVPATNDDGATNKCGWDESSVDWKIIDGQGRVGELGDVDVFWEGLLCAETLYTTDWCNQNTTGFGGPPNAPTFDIVVCCGESPVAGGIQAQWYPVDYYTGDGGAGAPPGYVPESCVDPELLIIRNQNILGTMWHTWVAYAELAVTNTPPVANPDFYMMSEDSALTVGAPGILNNDFDADGDPLTALYDGLGPTHGSLTVHADGSIEYTPNANWCGIDTFQYNAYDGEANSELATVEITVICVDDPPVAVDDTFSIWEDGERKSLRPWENDTDIDGGPYAIDSVTQPSHGTAELVTHPTLGQRVFYQPDPDYCNKSREPPVIGPTDDFTYTLAPGGSTATISMEVLCVDDPPVITSITPGAGTVDYSDYIEQVTIVARDVDSDILQLRYSCLDGGWTCLPDDLPDVVTLNTTEVCTLLPDLGDGPGAECTYTLDGQVTEPGFEQWDIGFMAVDEYQPYTRLVKCLPAYVGTGKPYSDLSDCQYNLTVHPEDATVRLDDGNQVAIEVDEDDGLSGPFDLHFIAWETNDNTEDEGSPQFGDAPDYSEVGTACGNGSPDCVDHGYLGNAEVFMDLVPVGPGGPVSGTCAWDFDPPLPYSDYDQILIAHCDFDDVPVNTYVVEARVGEGFEVLDTYYFGTDEDAFTVFDPNAGFTTGGGYLYWPNTERPLGSKWEYFGNLIPDPCTVYYYYLLGYEEGYPGDKTNFGWTMKYNKKGTNLQGNALVVRHVMEPRLFLGFIPYCADVGKFRIKSNALDYLVIGESPEGTDPAFGFTIFSGKATYREPGWEENVGNHKFFIYAEDYGDQGCGQDPSDRFWLEVQDKDGNIVWQPQMGSDPVIAAENIQCGNIVVPHGGGDKGGKGEGKPDK